MSYIRVDMIDEDFQLDNFIEFRDSEKFKQLTTDWEQFKAMCLEEANDRGIFDTYYNQSLDIIADEKERQQFLLLKIYTFKYQNVIEQYPSVEHFLMFIIHRIQKEQSNSDASSGEQLDSDALYKRLINNFHNLVAEYSQTYAPADFAVLFINDSLKIEPVQFYEKPPGTSERVKMYKGVRLRFSRKIVCEVKEDERIHMYTHLELPETLGNCIVSVLPRKRLTEIIKGWDVLTPYNLGESPNTTKESIGLEPEKDVRTISVCSIDDLNIISYDTSDLDIRTFTNLIFTYPKNFGNQLQ